MLFNSIDFIIFFPIVLFIYFLLPHRFRWLLLLGSSYYFYMSWKPEYVILIMLSTIVDYLAGIKIENSKKKKTKKKFLFASLFVNLGLLFTFKYFNFFSSEFTEFLKSFSLSFDAIELKLLLPVGISFYTFQTLSYTIDVYRGKIKAEYHLGRFAVYVSFFPQLVAGPIERAKNLLPQFVRKVEFDYVRVTDGLKIMLWGFFLKMVIADRLALAVNEVYNNLFDYTGWSLLIATYYFAFQIFCDFAGYSFIAIGAAKIMGFDLMDNFRRPYFSKSISEFWKRWHISLSTWFRDYLYIPLGGNRVVKLRNHFNIFFVFLVSGFWHGAGWNFLIWGALHGFYLIFSILTKDARIRMKNLLGLNKHPIISKSISWFTTFHLVLFAWIFFRAASLTDAWYVLTNMFSGLALGSLRSSLPLGINYTILVLAFILFMEFIHVIQERRGMRHFLNSKPIYFRWAAYQIILLLILLFGVFQRQEFLYFQF